MGEIVANVYLVRMCDPEYINRIGNLTLLTERDNQNLSGKSYAQKRDFYLSHSKKIVNMINSELWDIDSVNERSRVLAIAANEIFK